MAPQQSTTVTVRRIEDYCPTTSLPRLGQRLQIGDILLVSGGHLDWVRPVVLFQRRFKEFSPASKKFTHAGIYVGRETVVHSVPDISMDKWLAGGVEHISLKDFLSDGVTFAVLRFPGLTAEHHEALRDAVTLHVDKPYDYMGILRCLGFMMQLPRRALSASRTKDLGLARALVCTDFVYAVYDEVFQHKNPFNLPNGYLTPVRLPCEIFSNPNFIDVDLGDGAFQGP